MAKLVPKLNLNKMPQLCEESSLVCANNVRALRDGSISVDTTINKFVLSEYKSSILTNLTNKIGQLNSDIVTITEQIEDIDGQIEDINPSAFWSETFTKPFCMPDESGNDFYCSEDEFSTAVVAVGSNLTNQTIRGYSKRTPRIVNNIGNLAAYKSVFDSSYVLFPANITHYINAFLDNCLNEVYNDVAHIATIIRDLVDYDNLTKLIKESNPTYYASHFYEFPDVQYGNIYGEIIYYVDLWYIGHLYAFFDYCFREQEIGGVLQPVAVDINDLIDYNVSTLKSYLTLVSKKEEKQKEIEDINATITEYTAEYNKLNASTSIKILGTISDNTKVYFLCKDFTENTTYSCFIFKYDEYDNNVTLCRCNWTSPALATDVSNIDGVCTKTLRGETILSIAEYINDNYDIPIKTINLNKAKFNDNESIYTQTPVIDFINLSLDGYYPAAIRPGIYTFFVRYEISDNTYTTWFPASKELYTAKKISKNTSQGTVQAVLLDENSDKGFILKVNREVNTGVYKRFQLGFINSTPGETVARAWKHFNIDTELIYFDRAEEYIEEIDINDLIGFNFGLYNVKNITAFKTKLYISNYTESNFNDKVVKDFSKTIAINIKSKPIHTHFVDDSVTPSVNYDLQKDGNYITSFKSSDTTKTAASVTGECATFINSNLTDQSQVIANTFCFNVKLSIVRTDSTTGYKVDVHHVLLSDGTTNVDTTSASTTNLEALATVITGIMSDYSVIYHDSEINESYIYNTAKTKKLVKLVIHTNYDARDVEINFLNNKIILANNLLDSETLIPYQHYNFYVHLVKNTGEITNGYKIGNTITIDDYHYYNTVLTDNNVCLIYPIFNFTSALPAGYSACFISIKKVKNKSIQLFGYEKVGDSMFANALELDMLLCTAYSNLQILGYMVNLTGDYYASADVNNLYTFASTGKVVAPLPSSYEAVNTKPFIVLDSEVVEDDTLLLSKCTPYIIPEVDNSYYCYDKPEELSLYGYLCEVVKPVYNEYQQFVAGSEISTKSVSNCQIVLESIEHPNYDLQSTTKDIIYSNYNLNYVKLAENSYFYPKVHDSKLYLTSNSLNLNMIYKLDECFYDFTRKLYSVYNDHQINVFNNTIRSSEQIGDEDLIAIYRFEADAYYNSPVDKGIITNLKAIGNSILVHTEDSLFKFTGENTLSANGGEQIKLSEQESVFDTGISQVFGSEYGFGGLKSKEHFVVSENNYTFYDADSNNIYMYRDNSQLKVISDDIRKLLDYKPITSVKLANDFYNDRIFIYIKFNNDKYVTLSYNFRFNNFISLHNIVFNKAFNTKTRCYFIKDTGNTAIYYTNTTFTNTDYSYQLYDTINFIYPVYTDRAIGSQIDKANPYVDVIFNDKYDVVKVLNCVNYICNKIVGFNKDYEPANIVTYNVVQEDLERYKGKNMIIYTNLTSTNKIDLSDPDNGSNINNYTKPVYNLGKWSLNYFRNALNTTDIYSYGNPATHSDNRSLIYGNYIVVRIIFDINTNFKFESININTSNEYEKALY